MRSNLIGRSRSRALPEETNKVLRNTFITLALTMIPTIFGAMFGVQHADLFTLHPIGMLIGILGGGILLMIGIFANKDNGAGLLLLFLFTALMGFSSGGIINYALGYKNGGELIALAFAGTAAAMVGMSFVAITSKKDFSYLGGGLFACLSAIIVLELLNVFFFQAPIMMILISMFGAVVFSMYILYDVSQIVNGHEDNYIVATLSIYLDLFNLFLDLLRLLLAFNGSDD